MRQFCDKPQFNNREETPAGPLARQPAEPPDALVAAVLAAPEAWGLPAGQYRHDGVWPAGEDGDGRHYFERLENGLPTEKYYPVARGAGAAGGAPEQAAEVPAAGSAGPAGSDGIDGSDDSLAPRRELSRLERLLLLLAALPALLLLWPLLAALLQTLWALAALLAAAAELAVLSLPGLAAWRIIRWRREGGDWRGLRRDGLDWLKSAFGRNRERLKSAWNACGRKPDGEPASAEKPLRAEPGRP